MGDAEEVRELSGAAAALQDSTSERKLLIEEVREQAFLRLVDELTDIVAVFIVREWRLFVEGLDHLGHVPLEKFRLRRSEHQRDAVVERKRDGARLAAELAARGQGVLAAGAHQQVSIRQIGLLPWLLSPRAHKSAILASGFAGANRSLWRSLWACTQMYTEPRTKRRRFSSDA